VSQRPVIPTATYRLQLHPGFGLDEAAAIAPYLAEIGISHLYCSPLLSATHGSKHGYDVCDHAHVNPELGGTDALDRLTTILQNQQMGLLVDFVPNHMSLDERLNPWWRDVLENGPSSPHARSFDIDWAPSTHRMHNQVLVPILDAQYGRVLENGAFHLRFEGGAFVLGYGEHRLPLAPCTWPSILRGVRTRIERSGASPPELASILTAIEHLPGLNETEPSRMAERAREKEIIKERLANLCASSADVATAIQDETAEIESGRNHFHDLDDLLSMQPYRLAYWRVASEEINYRRFFDVNSLGGLRMELPEVFESAHRLLLNLCQRGVIDGVRIDHIDGLREPLAYLQRLQDQFAHAVGNSVTPAPLYLVVEKVLAPGEELPDQWPVHGTTGYDFGAQITALLVDASAEKAFSQIYKRTTRYSPPFAELAYQSKRLTMEVSMASELHTLGRLLSRVAASHRWYRDFTLSSLTTAVREVIACFPIYRTYLNEAPGRPEDPRTILTAIAAARSRNPALERTVFDFLREVLLPRPGAPHPVDEQLRGSFVGMFQQYTGPVMAKGVEDTAFYVYNRLLALNEVGADPSRFGLPPECFHQLNLARIKRHPHALLTTSTHDTKRSEDVRARLAALSEFAAEWQHQLRIWRRINRRHHQRIENLTAPDPNEEYFIYQTLLGTWPLEPMNGDGANQYALRLQSYLQKALHEAKTHSSWLAPNDAWDHAIRHFLKNLLDRRHHNPFLEKFLPFAALIAQTGAVNSLTQVTVKLTAPGVPDLYQGQELWDFSLVDPDNRREVDFEQRRRAVRALRNGRSARSLLARWRNGFLKLHITRTLLRFRRRNPEFFLHAGYAPMAASGTLAPCCFTFLRSHGDCHLLVLTTRLSSRIGFPPVGRRWAGNSLAIPSGGPWRELLTGASYNGKSPAPLSALLRRLPVAVWSRGFPESHTQPQITENGTGALFRQPPPSLIHAEIPNPNHARIRTI